MFVLGFFFSPQIKLKLICFRLALVGQCCGIIIFKNKTTGKWRYNKPLENSHSRKLQEIHVEKSGTFGALQACHPTCPTCQLHHSCSPSTWYVNSNMQTPSTTVDHLVLRHRCIDSLVLTSIFITRAFKQWGMKKRLPKLIYVTHFDGVSEIYLNKVITSWAWRKKIIFTPKLAV